MSDPVLTASGQPIYGRTPRALLRDPVVSAEAVRLWGILEDHCSKEQDVPWPSQDRLAGFMGASDRSVRNWLNELVRFGWLKVEQRPGKSNRHHLLWEPETSPRNAASGVPRNGVSTPPRNQASGHPGTGVPTKKNQEEEPVEEPTPNPSDGGETTASLFAQGTDGGDTSTRAERQRAGYDKISEIEFERWWDLYPSKDPGGNRGSKATARRAWGKLGKREFTATEMFDRLDVYLHARTVALARWGGPAPLLNASTFLNGKHEDWVDSISGPDDPRVGRWEFPCSKRGAEQARDRATDKIAALRGA